MRIIQADAVIQISIAEFKIVIVNSNRTVQCSRCPCLQALQPRAQVLAQLRLSEAVAASSAVTEQR
jgi:hypothetical protein